MRKSLLAAAFLAATISQPVHAQQAAPVQATEVVATTATVEEPIPVGPEQNKVSPGSFIATTAAAGAVVLVIGIIFVVGMSSLLASG